MSLERLLGALRRQLLLVLLAVAVTGVAAYQLAKREPNKYSTEASMLLVGTSSSTGGTFAAGGTDITRFAAVQIELLKSLPIVDRAEAALGGDLARYSVTTGATEDILVVKSTSTEPALAQATADAIVDAYISYRSESETDQLRRSAELLQTQADEALAKVTEIDTSIAEKKKVIADAAADLGLSDEFAQALANDIEITQLVGARPTAFARYQSLYDRYQDLALEIELKGKPAERLSSAELPTTPESPKPVQSAIFGVFAGLMLGVGAAALREQMDTRLRSRRELEQRLGLPVLAELPYDRGFKSRKVGALNGPLHEAVRSLRTSIEVLGIDEPIARLMVTSATSGEGKTTVVAELATAFARLGRRVVVVSADLRRPMVETQFGITDLVPGVSDFVMANEELLPAERAHANHAPHLRMTHEDGLFVVPAGTMIHNPAEVLASDGFANLLESLGSSFDVVIVDTPPLLVVADAAIVAQTVHAVVAVASVRDARKDPVDRFADALRALPGRVLGVAVNKGRSAGRYDYGGAYYSKGLPTTKAPPTKHTAGGSDSKRRDREPAGR